MTTYQNFCGSPLALRLALAVWGEEASNTLIYLANLAFCLDKLGRSTEALPLHQHALDLLKMVLGKRHLETLSSLHNQALCLMSLGRAAKALPLLEQALAGRRKVLGERHPDTLTILNNQAACLRDLNRTAEALSLDQQALALRREVLGERHPDTLISLTNVALCFVMLGRSTEALPLCQQALALRRQALGERHPDTLRSLNNLAVCLDTLNRSAEALPLFEQALGLYRDVLGEHHPDTLTSLNDLVSCLDNLGRAEEALPLHQQALALSHEVLGERHPNTLTRLYGLETCLMGLGRAEEALPLYQKAFELSREVLGERHPSTLLNLSSLALLFTGLGQTEKALPLFQQLLELSRGVLGECHPDILTSLNNLADCLGALGVEALPLLEQVLAQHREVLGERHPDTLASRNNLADCLAVLDRWAEALPLYQQALALRREVLGERHPDTLGSLHHQAVCLLYLGSAAEALPLLQQALAQHREVLGERHRNTLSSLNSLTACLIDLGRSSEALPLCQQALALHRAVLGESHPNTGVSLQNLAHCLDNLGRGSEALPLYQQVFMMYRDMLGDRDPNTVKNTACILNNWAICLDNLEQPQEALPLYQQALALEREVLDEHHPYTLGPLQNLASCLHHLGQTEEALPLYQQALALDREVLGECHPKTLKALNNLAHCLKDLGRTPEALLFFEQASALSQQGLGEHHFVTLTTLGNLAHCQLYDVALKKDPILREWDLDFAYLNWQKLAKLLVDCPLPTSYWPTLVLKVANAFLWAVNAGVTANWVGPFQALSRAWLEVLDLQPPEQVAVLREPFQRFHRIYLYLCLREQRTDLLPSLLTALQGRQLAALMLEELEQTLAAEVATDAPRHKDVQDLLVLRQKLRQAALGLQVIEGGRGRRDEDGPQRIIRADPATRDARFAAERQQRADYDKLYRQYHDLLGKLRQSEPDFALAAPALDIDLPTLQAGLAAEDALAMLLHVRATTDDPDDATVFVFLITARDHQLLQLPTELLTLPTHAWRRQEAISDRAGLRYTNTAGADATAASPDSVPGDGLAAPAAWTAAMDRHFWQPLAPALSGIHTVHLVSHGDFHVLPYAAGGPPERTVYTYPGLLFYHHRQRPRAAEAAAPPHPSPAAPLGLHGYTAADHPDHPTIPLVEAETRLIAALWPEAVRTPLTLAPAEPVTFLHCAGHGQHPTVDPLSAKLVLGPNASLDCRALFRSALRPRVVFLSACVVGRTSEDRDGEPLGLVSAFLLRGATYVIAPLQPVSDCLMPLLAGLFHQAWRAGLAPPQALAEAKRRLAEGDWYPDTAERVRVAYTATLERYLPALLAEPDPERQKQGLRALRRWPLPPAYAHAGEISLRAQLASDRGRQGFITDFLNHLEQNRRALPVADLLPWVVGFGGPAA